MNADINDVVNNLCQTIAAQAREIAILRAQLDSLEKALKGAEKNEPLRKPGRSEQDQG